MKYHPDETAGGNAVTELMLETFRLNGRLLASGDRLVAPIGLTSARWQVLGAIALSGRPQPVAHIARDMGLTRQAVQRVVNELEREGIVSFMPNPHHRRAKLVALSESGKRVYDAAMERHTAWSNGLAEKLSPRDIARATALMRELRTRIEQGEDTAD